MDLADLVELEAIKRLKYRYLRCLDQKLWDEMATCFTPDATASYGGGAYPFDGRDAILDFLRRNMGSEQMLSSHRCHHPEIDLDPPVEGQPRTARGTWALEDYVIMRDFDVTVRGAAFYEDRYVRTDDGWRIASTGYLRTFEEIQPRAPVEGLQITADFYATGGRSTLPAG